ncbi:hypothetical protein ACFC08_28715 [Streptomyces sp. NPDC056112]|uniref:hypothetical protein n=1 Tax=Streptomyces sp. NPDC056112 TaxID=3345715 RepID=UPI0035D5A341
MTDQPSMSEPTATPTCQTIELQLTGYPDENYRWGGGRIRPTRVAITTLNDRRIAHLYGTWVSENDEATNDPCDQLYRHDDDWPDWLTALADKHRPHGLIARPGSPTTGRDEDDPRADGLDELRAQSETAQKQADAWAARVQELSRMIAQREEQAACERTAP